MENKFKSLFKLIYELFDVVNYITLLIIVNGIF